MKSLARHIAAPLLIGFLLLFIPLIRDFHIESALLVATAGCFWALWVACSKMVPQNDGRSILRVLGIIYTAGLPLFIYGLITGCLSWHGMGFWLMYPLPSVLFGYSLGRLLRKWNVPYRRIIGTVILLFVALGVLLIEFFSVPQVYFFNHVWGGWPGPIYDETVTISSSLVFYRLLTLAWAGLFWFLPVFHRSSFPKIAALACTILLVVGYSQLATMGVLSPRSYLQQQLTGQKQTDHFTIFYDEDYYSTDEIGFIAAKHEFYFHQIIKRLNIQWPAAANKIESYLYGHPWQKKKLVGAKFTSYVPVWLQQDQLHIAKHQIDGSLKHELVHVLSKQFGNQLFNASWSIGLIEGLAVALAPEASSVSTINQIVVSEKPYPTARAMQQALSPLGFYGGRSAVNYTQSGSFVQFLLDNYPIQNFKEAYRLADVGASYHPSFRKLVQEWHSTLDTIQVDSTDRRIAERLYSLESLFEQQCPHVLSDFARQWDQFQLHMAKRDTARALPYLNRAKKLANNAGPVATQWAYLHLKMGNVEKVAKSAVASDSLAETLLLYADAFKLNGQPAEALEYIKKAELQLKQQWDDDTEAALRVRLDSIQWNYHRAVVYEQAVVKDSVFSKMDHRTQIRALREAMARGKVELLKRYGSLIEVESINPSYLDTYIDAIEQLAYGDDIALAQKWLGVLQSKDLRPRYRERIGQACEFITYIQLISI